MDDFGGAHCVQDEGLDELLLGYGITRPYLFTNLRNFKAKCYKEAKDLIEGKDIPQYLAFKHVKQAIADQIDQHLEDHRGLPHITNSYDSRLELLIMKLMAGAWHAVATGMFGDILTEKVNDQAIHRSQLTNVGSTTFGLPSSSRSKSADVAYKPRTRTLVRDWPSVVIEVGLSKSLCGLENDAHFWLTQSGGQTHIVFIVAINRTTKDILIQRWEDVPSSPLVGFAYNPSLMQMITLEANVYYDGLPLHIPTDKVFDVMPQGISPGGLYFTTQDLNSFRENYWAVLV